MSIRKRMIRSSTTPSAWAEPKEVPGVRAIRFTGWSKVRRRYGSSVIRSASASVSMERRCLIRSMFWRAIA